MWCECGYSAGHLKSRPQQLSGALHAARKLLLTLRLESAAAQLLSAPKIVRNDARTALERPMAGWKCSSCDLCCVSRALDAARKMFTMLRLESAAAQILPRSSGCGFPVLSLCPCSWFLFPVKKKIKSSLAHQQSSEMIANKKQNSDSNVYTVTLLPCGTRWYLVALTGTLWHTLVPSGTRWYLVALAGTLWHSLVPCGTR